MLEMAPDTARRLRDAQTARGMASLEGLAPLLRHAAPRSPARSGKGLPTSRASRTPRSRGSTSQRTRAVSSA